MTLQAAPLPTATPVVADPVVAAVLACVARTGVGGLTVDDIAREAGCSRATLYRSHPSKQALIDAAVADVADRLVVHLTTLATDAPDLAGAVTAVVVGAVTWLRAEPAVAAVMEREPHLLHPHLAFEGGDRFLVAATERLAPAFARFGDDPVRVAAWTVRLGLCLGWFPDPPVRPADPHAIADLVATFVAPGLASVEGTGLRLVPDLVPDLSPHQEDR